MKIKYVKKKLKKTNIKGIINFNIFIKSLVIYLFSIKFNENSNNIISKIAKIAKNGINHKFIEVPVSYGLNNDIYFPTLVSITSILLNANNNTYYKIYILVSSNRTQFSNENKRKFKHLERKYKMCKIFIIEINDKIFSFAKLGKYPIPTYYRIIIARLLPYEKRIIFIYLHQIFYYLKCLLI